MAHGAFKLEIALKQHTPIIHFQHEQEGATLRATELKPKLDRFIIQRCVDEDGIRKKYLSWLSPGKHMALAYRISVIAKDITWTDTKGWGCFFADMGNINKNRYKAGVGAEIRLTISSLNIDLITYIKENICLFFSNHCFGTRQSKGYGFFYPEEKSEAFSNSNNFAMPSGAYKFDVDVSRSYNAIEKAKTLFENIDLFYRVLRSGVNLKSGPDFLQEDINNDGKDEYINIRSSRFYCKPILFSFLKEKGLQWDKKTIKQTFFNVGYFDRKPDNRENDWINSSRIGYTEKVYERGLERQIETLSNSDTLTFQQTAQQQLALWKDLFGLSTEENWKSYNTTVKKTHVSLQNEKWMKKPAGDADEIVRYQSPLRFFPFLSSNGTKYTVHMTVQPEDPVFKSSRFMIEGKSKSIERKSKSITLPIANLYSVKDILDWIILKPFVLSSHVERKFQRSEEYRKLNQVFETLKEGMK